MSRFPRADLTLVEALREWRDEVVKTGADEKRVDGIVQRIELLGKGSNKMRAMEADDLKSSLTRLLDLIRAYPGDPFVACHEDVLVIAVAAYSLVPYNGKS
jgi:hypothetical protein